MEEDVIDYLEIHNCAMASVNELNDGQQDEQSDTDWQRRIEANVDHLIVTLEYNWPEEFDLTPFQEALAAHQN